MNKLSLRPLLIFTGKYPDDSSLDREGVANTANLMKTAFFTKLGLNIPEESGCVIEDDKFVPANGRIRDFISSLNTEKDLALIYFCGHGFPDYKHNSVVLSMSDTTSRNWPYCGIRHDNLIEILKQCSIKNYIIILDCCNSGFLCGMGDESTDTMFMLPEDENAEGVVYISSTQRDDITLQTKIEDKYYIPFSYYFAKVLLGADETLGAELSIQQIYNSVKKSLDNTPNYFSRCAIQSKGDINNAKLFKRSVGNVGASESNKIFPFSNFFSITELKVLLVKSAIKYPIKYDDFGVPLGLWMLKGHLSTSGLSLKVDIFDERLELRRCNDDIAARENVKAKFESIVEDYDVIGISMCTSEVWPALQKFEIAKKAQKITFCGGIFTSSNENYLLKSGLVDYVIPGVSTVPLTSLLARLLQDKRQGLLGQHIVNEYGVASKDSLDQFDAIWTPTILPTMRKSIWLEIIDQYGEYLRDERTHKKRMDVYTARGCNRNCTFCSVQRESKQTILRKSPDCVIDEIKYLESQGIEYFSFKDEDLLSDPERMFGILEAIHKEGVLLKIRARCDEMMQNKIPLERLHELGVDEIQYGIESPDIHLQRNVSKGFPRDSNERSLIDFIRSHEKYGIKANCSFILGITGEDSEYYDDLFQFIKEIYDNESKPKIYINFLTPHPINSQFPSRNYVLATNDLNYFTHKFPVCYAQDSTYGKRKKMLETYDRIVEYTNSSLYNPPTSKIPETLKKAFLSGKSKLTSKDMPQYIKEKSV